MLSLHPSGAGSGMRGIGDLGVNCPRDVKQIIHLDCPGAWCGGGVGEESSKRRKKGFT
jgi:hypothetical protein